jgi:nicotinamide-nucleotide amidase
MAATCRGRLVTGLVERVSERLTDRGLRLTTAESCTGGMVAARLTDPAGASRFLSAGLVTYSDGAKTRVLGVRPETLAAYGAVSEPVVREMLTGARAAGESEAAVAITGVAGPGGGSADKPVGTVWVAASVLDRIAVERHHFPGDRAAVREASVRAALELLDRILEST